MPVADGDRSCDLVRPLREYGRCGIGGAGQLDAATSLVPDAAPMYWRSVTVTSRSPAYGPSGVTVSAGSDANTRRSACSSGG